METKKCSQCTKDIPKNAKKCPECQSDLRSWFSRHPIITVLLFVFIVLPFLSWVISWITTPIENSNSSTVSIKEDQVSDSSIIENANQADNVVNEVFKEEVQEVSSNWRYTEDIDKMDGWTTNFAINTSTNEVFFEFPYNGGSTFDLTIRKWDDGEKILFSVSKGQFLSTFNGWEARIKFDDGEPFMVWTSWTADYASDVIFLWSEKKLIEWMKNSENMMIETQFYDSWKQIAEFKVNWLNW